MKKYVVTGGAGFIGSALVRSLVARDDGEVHIIDNLFSGKKQNLKEIWPRIELHISDIRNYDEILPVIRNADTAFHLAAIPSVPRSIHEPVPSHEVNIDGTFNVFRAAAEGEARRVVYAASSSAYGDTAVLPKVETMTPQPKSPYAAQKLMGEYYVGVFNSCFGLDTVSLRFFNVYGERQDPSSPYSGVISLFMTALLDRRAPAIFGDGEQTRDFTYVEDVVDLTLKAASARGVAGKVYNAGNGHRYSLNEVWRTLQTIEGVEIAPVHAAPRAGDVRDSLASIDAARELIGYEPKVNVREGLQRTIAAFRQLPT